jgi:hypothetical protein
MHHVKSEPVHMERRRHAFLPDAFVWRGHRYDVRCVERSWTLARSSGNRRIERRYFRVRCDQGCFDLYHDLLANTWCIDTGG